MIEKEKVKRKTEGGQKVEFSFYAPERKGVFLAGDFNNWDSQSLPMKKDEEGAWKTKVKLPPGRYEYKFFTDSSWVEDLPGIEKVPNQFGTNNFVIQVT